MLGDYWRHLVDNHQFETNFDINLEYDLMKDYLLHGMQMPDNGIVELQCDHIRCKYKQSYQILYYVKRINEEDEEE